MQQHDSIESPGAKLRNETQQTHAAVMAPSPAARVPVNP